MSLRQHSACIVGMMFIVGLARDVRSADGQVVLKGTEAQVSIAVSGGGIVEFRFLDQPTNPLNWEVTPELEPLEDGKPYLRGHFLCLDRWGPPSEAEVKNGVPFHGEAPRVVWQVIQQAQRTAGGTTAQMRCTLPIAGLQVLRTIKLDTKGTLLTVTELVTNTNRRGRLFNMVQHPSIAPPFLDPSTLVDSNARQGFWQDGPIPASRQSASAWPKLVIDNRRVDLRRFQNTNRDITRHDVSSFVFDDAVEYGWVTACNPGQRLLLGYIWQTRDYPWLNIWRYIRDGQVAARGLEFGTTGLHQPFPELVKTNRIFARALYEYLDAQQTISKSYSVFLARTPSDYEGVSTISYTGGKLTLNERRQQNPRALQLEVGTLVE